MISSQTAVCPVARKSLRKRPQGGGRTNRAVFLRPHRPFCGFAAAWTVVVCRLYKPCYGLIVTETILCFGGRGRINHAMV